MLAMLTAALLLGAPAADGDALAPKRELFAAESWYKDQKGEEKDFAGLLSKLPGDKVGIGRLNPFRLTGAENGKPVVREVYVGAHPEYLAPYVGHKIKLIGKAVDTEVEGQVHAEVWPARLELLDAAPAPEATPAVPDRLDILVGNKVYTADPTPEKSYIGVLEKKKGEDAVGYTLAVDTGDHIDREDIHLFDPHYAIFDPYAGMKVKIVGKKVTGQVRGSPFAYILPGRLEVASVGIDKTTGRELKVAARSDSWPFMGAAPIQHVVRTPQELALARGRSKDQATDDHVQEQEATLTARLFNVNTLDMSRQMIVVVSPGAEPTGGYTVEITGLVVQDDVLHVHWKVNAPKPGDVVTQSVTHPVQAVLTDHFDGETVFDAAPGK